MLEYCLKFLWGHFSSFSFFFFQLFKQSGDWISSSIYLSILKLCQNKSQSFCNHSVISVHRGEAAAGKQLLHVC